ncbi:unnamed protein product [Closterium sp. NIES-54]
MRKLLRGMRLPSHQWPEAMDHAVKLHNLLSSSSLPNNASPHLLWIGKLGNTKMLRVFGCMRRGGPSRGVQSRGGGGTEPWGAEPGGTETGGAEPGGAGSARVASRGASSTREVLSPLELREWFARRWGRAAGAGGTTAAVGSGGTQQSSQGYTFSLGSGSVSWRSTRSSSVLSSSCEAEIYVGAMAAQELLLLTYLLTDLGEQPRSPPVLYVDNKAMLALCREQRLEHRTKHIALRYFLARELQQRGQLRLAYVASEANTADIFTKALAPGDHQRFCTMLANRDLTGGFRGNRAFASAADEADWDEQNVDGASEEAGPLPYCSVPIPMDDENPRESINAETYFDFADTVRILLAIAAMNRKKLRQIDVANAFLYGPVDAEIFVELPHGSTTDSNQVCQLEKIYVRHQTSPEAVAAASSRPPNPHRIPHDQGMYRLTRGTDYILLNVYVDDLLCIGSTDDITTWFEGELQRDLTLTVATIVTQYLGLNIQDGDNAIYLSAENYMDTIAKRFGLTPTVIPTPYCYTDGNHKVPTLLKPAGIRNYQRKLGCLLFAAVTCRPNLSYSASQLTTYLEKPEAEHMLELGRALHYLVSTPTIGLTYHKTGTTTPKLIGYVDADHAGDADNRRSRIGYIFNKSNRRWESRIANYSEATRVNKSNRRRLREGQRSLTFD